MCFACMTMASCKEDPVKVDVKDITTNYYPAPTDTTSEASLRRDFYAEYGSFLLFNDTLQHYATGQDVNGDTHYFTEKLDIQYEIGISTMPSAKFTFTLLNDYSLKSDAVSYLKEYILCHLTGKLLPYSWLLVDKITRDFNGNISSPYAATGQNCVVVACNMLPRLKPSQKTQFTSQVMNTIIAKLVTDNAAAFDDFYAISSAYYDGTFKAPSTTAENLKQLNAAGFICQGQNDIGANAMGYYPSQELDVAAFARLVVANSEETLQSKYETWTLVLQKCNVMRKILTNLGYQF